MNTTPRLESSLRYSLPDLVNFLMISRADVVHVEGPRGSLSAKRFVLDRLEECLPNCVRYEAALQHHEVDTATGAILGPHYGLDVGQARLGALDFLEQVPVDQLVLFDRSPLSSLVYEPESAGSEAEVHGWLHRVQYGRLRQVLVVAVSVGAKDHEAEEQERLFTALKTVLNRVDLRMHVFIVRVHRQLSGTHDFAVSAEYLSPHWNYR